MEKLYRKHKKVSNKNEIKEIKEILINEKKYIWRSKYK